MPPPEGDNGNWRDSLPAEYKADERLARFKDQGSFIKSYLDLESFVSSTGRVPKPDDNNPENWNKFYKSWGRPEKPDEFKYPDLPKEYQLQDPMKQSISKMAHDLGLNQKQFNQMVTWGIEQSKLIEAAQNAELDRATKGLKDKWGYKYETNRDRTNKTIASLVGFQKDHPFVQWLESTGNINNPVVIEFFHEVADKLGEDNFVDEQSKKEDSDRETAGRKVREIMADDKHPYFNANDPRHKDAVAEVARLYEVMSGE